MRLLARPRPESLRRPPTDLAGVFQEKLK